MSDTDREIRRMANTITERLVRGLVRELVRATRYTSRGAFDPFDLSSLRDTTPIFGRVGDPYYNGGFPFDNNSTSPLFNNSLLDTMLRSNDPMLRAFGLGALLRGGQNNPFSNSSGFPFGRSGFPGGTPTFGSPYGPNGYNPYGQNGNNPLSPYGQNGQNGQNGQQGGTSQYTQAAKAILQQVLLMMVQGVGNNNPVFNLAKLLAVKALVEVAKTYTEAAMSDEVTNASPQARHESLLVDAQIAQMRGFVETSMQYWNTALRAYLQILKDADNNAQRA